MNHSFLPRLGGFTGETLHEEALKDEVSQEKILHRNIPTSFHHCDLLRCTLGSCHSLLVTGACCVGPLALSHPNAGSFPKPVSGKGMVGVLPVRSPNAIKQVRNLGECLRTV